MAQSGIDSLLDALRESGMNVDGIDGGAQASSSEEETSSASAEASSGGSGSRRGSRSSSRGDMPFGGFPFFGGFPGQGAPRGDDGGSGDEPPHVEFGSSLGDRMAEWSKRTLIIAIIVAIIILLAAYWWFHPPISINSMDTWMFVTIFILAPLFLFFSGKSRRYKKGGGKIEPSPSKAKTFKILSFIPIIILVLGLIGWVCSLDLFPGNAKKYANVLQTETQTFAEDIQEVNYSQIPVIDRDSAILLGNREMGSIPDYVSQFEINNLYSQINYKEKPVRVSPLGYADLFKWFMNRGEGIPAYSLVDMTTQDAEIVRLGEGNGMKYTASEPLARNIDRYVQLKYPFFIFDEKSFEIDPLYSQINYKGAPVRVSPLGYADLFKWFTNRGEGIPAFALVDMTTQDAEIVRLGEGNGMKYTASEPLARNIDRYVQLKYPFYIFDEKSFEIDEDGQPWWICPVRQYTIGLFGGETINRVILCNASTGECTEYDVADVPQWVDRVYPAELLLRQYNWSGRYQQGWFNSWLGQSGVVQTTPGSNGSLGYNYIAKDDDVWVSTGVTSATADNSIVGFVLIDQRTAESHYYAVSGATETSAMESAEGQVQNLRYVATFPLLINVSNQPTYFMALKDGAGLVKKFAMIDIQRYQNVAVGDTVLDCQKSYETLLATNGALTAADVADSATYGETSGTIRTMAQAVIEGNTHYYITLEGQNAIYDFVLPGALPIVGYAVGDEIAFSYVESEPACTVSEILSNKFADEKAKEVKENDASAGASSAAASTEAASAEAASASAAGTSASASAQASSASSTS